METLLALLVLSAVILFHEFGHYLLARKNGITVTGFSLGMGPKLFSWQRGDTVYSIKLFPIGGSCVMLEEDSGRIVPGSFLSASVWGRFWTVFAGPLFNFIMAFVIAVVIVCVRGYIPPVVTEVDYRGNAWLSGIREGDVITKVGKCRIGIADDIAIYEGMNTLEEGDWVRVERIHNKEKLISTYRADKKSRYLLGFTRISQYSMEIEDFTEDSALKEAGLKKGDIITAINGTNMDGAEFLEYIEENPLDGTPIDVTYERDGDYNTVTIVPREQITYGVGFSFGDEYVRPDIFKVVPVSIAKVSSVIRTTFASLKGLLTGRFSARDMSGPVGVVEMVGISYKAGMYEGVIEALVNILSMAMLISANLGIMNLLPIPALDGGRIVFILIEMLQKKPVDRELEGKIHGVGFALLMCLMLFVFFQDLFRFW